MGRAGSHAGAWTVGDECRLGHVARRAGEAALLVLAALPTPVVALLVLMAPGAAKAVVAPRPWGLLARAALCALALAPGAAWLALDGTCPHVGRRRLPSPAAWLAPALARACAETCAVWSLLAPGPARPSWPDPVATLLAVRAQGLGSAALDRCLLPVLAPLSLVLLVAAWLGAVCALSGPSHARRRVGASLATMADDGAGPVARGGAGPMFREVGE